MASDRKSTACLAITAMALLVACGLVGCSGYSEPPQDFKDSFIMTEVTGKGELGTISEFERGLALITLNNGKSPQVHGWTRQDNVYTLHFSLKDRECAATFTHILGGLGVDPENIGKICSLDQVSDGIAADTGVAASDLVLLALGALRESGVQTAADSYKQRREARWKKVSLYADLCSYIDGKTLGDSAIPHKVALKLKQLARDGQIQSSSDVDHWLRENASYIAAASQTRRFLHDEFHDPQGALSRETRDLYQQAQAAFERDEFNSVDDATAYLIRHGHTLKADQ